MEGYRRVCVNPDARSDVVYLCGRVQRNIEETMNLLAKYSTMTAPGVPGVIVSHTGDRATGARL
jgi:hypothetical protein